MPNHASLAAEAVSPPLAGETVLNFTENPMTTWQEEATAAISPNVLSNHSSLPPNSSMPQGVNYRGKPAWEMAIITAERQNFC